MIWIDKLLPIFTLLLGWGFAEFGKFSSNKKSDKKKLKKLLFNLLELRWLLMREMNLNIVLTEHLDRLKDRFMTEFGADAINGSEHLKHFIIHLLKDQIIQPDKIRDIEDKIDITIIELSEIYPVFAYELSGTYKIKEKLDSAQQYFENVTKQYGEFPNEIQDWIEPKLSSELIEELDSHIESIARMINKKTTNGVLEILEPNRSSDFEEFDDFLEEYIQIVKG